MQISRITPTGETIMKNEDKANTFRDNRVNMLKGCYANKIQNNYNNNTQITGVKKMAAITADYTLLPQGFINENQITGYKHTNRE